MDLGLAMRGEILADKLADGRAGRRLATWNTRRVPMRLSPGWIGCLWRATAGGAATSRCRGTPSKRGRGGVSTT